MIKLLFPVICGIVWVWRGWSFPKAIHGYFRAFLASFAIIGAYLLCTPAMSIFSVRGLFATLSLALLEGMLGYGRTCERIDNYYLMKQFIKTLPDDQIKESFAYLGFISMSYCLFPYMILHPDKPTWVYILIAILSFRIFPLNKISQLKVFNELCATQVLIIPIINKRIELPYWFCTDAWKIVEFGIGMGFGLWLSGILV